MAKRVRAKWSYYWAYGSNLSVSAMRRRCLTAEPVTSLVLDDGALVFRGVADVEGRAGSKVPGGLWKITPDDEVALDQYEGVSFGLYKKLYFPVRIKNKVHDVLFYKMSDRGIVPPSDLYLDVIKQGYEDFGLDLAYLDRAVVEAWENKRFTPRLRERHVRKGKPSMARPFLVAPTVDVDDEQLA